MDRSDLLKILVSAAAPLVPWLIYKRNSKQKLKEKQQEAIAELIKKLNENQIEFGFMVMSPGGGSGGHVIYRTLLDIGKSPIGSNNPEFDDEEICFHFKSNQIIGIKGFLNNPYIPQSIKSVLQDFYPADYINESKNDIQNETPLVTLSTECFIERPPFELERNQHPTQLKFPLGAIAYKSWLSFKTSCANLVSEINQYLDKINAKELKIL